MKEGAFSVVIYPLPPPAREREAVEGAIRKALKEPIGDWWVIVHEQMKKLGYAPKG